MMLYAALALVIIAVLSTIAELWGGFGGMMGAGQHASVTALVLAAVALLLFAVGAGTRKPAAPRSRR